MARRGVFDSRLVLTVRCKPRAMHALQDPCPIGDRGDHRRSGHRLGLALIPMPALWVEAQGRARHRLGDAPGAQVDLGQRTRQRQRGRKQARCRRGRARGGFSAARGIGIRENRLRTAKMRAGLGQKIGKAGDPRAFANDVEEITMFAGRAVGPFAPRTRSRGWAGQPDKQRPPRIVLQITDHPVGAFPPPGGKIMAANAFGILRKVAQ